MSDDTSVMSREYAETIRELAAHVEGGNESEANRLLDEITKQRESSLFQELGKLTRQFHEALNTFRLDSRIANIAEQDFPDAKERLRYVIEMTQQSADRSLTAAESSIPLCEGLKSGADELGEQWARFTRKELSADEFRQLSGRLGEFLGRVGEDSDVMRDNLNDVIMAQDFQDLTGQVITRVISLVDELEESLVDLIRISGANLIPQEKKEQPEETHEDRIKGTGPSIPGIDTEGVVSGQDEVDDLLSSLGF